MSASTENFNPRIYVACLAAYNNGYLHGVWIEASDDPDHIRAQVNAMLKASPVPDAEEYAIHDYEDFGGCDLGEFAGLDTAHAVATFLIETGKLGALLLSHFAGDLQDAQNALVNYAGEYESAADFAQGLTEETTTIPASLQYYIDYKSMARDMELNGDIIVLEEGFTRVHILWGR